MKTVSIFGFLFAFSLLFSSRAQAQTHDTLIIVTDSSKLLIHSQTLDSTPEPAVPKVKTRPKLPVDSTYVVYFYGTMDSLKAENFHHLDTSTLYFQQYDPLFHGNAVYSTLSNIGLAHKNMSFTPPLSFGFQMNNPYFSRYSYTNNQVKYYKLYVPYSEVKYVIGSKKEQLLAVRLDREIVRGFSVGLDVEIISSPGPYLRSKVDNKRYYFTTQYYTPNKRYGIVANYLRNRHILEESGGIRYDSIFEENLESNRRIIPVYLDSSNARNRITESGFYVEQYFNLLKPRSRFDTIKRKVDAGNISWSFRLKQNKRIYDDDLPTASFYRPYDPPIDSGRTYDSLFQQIIHNRVKWSSIGYNDDKLSQVFYIYFGADHHYIEQLLPYDSVKTTYGQITPFGGISLKLFKSSHLTADGRIVFGGYNSGDYQITAKLDQYLGTSERNVGELHFYLQLAGRTPSWFYAEYRSNRFRWKNDLNKETFLVFNAAYQFRQMQAGVEFSSFGNYTYLNDSARPQQTSTPGTVLKFFVKGNLPIGKFGVNTRLEYQSTSKPEVIRLPDFLGVLDVYFKTPVFNKAGTIQTGFQFNYFTSYYADAYMPELRRFYLQNEKEIGNYLFADFYFTLLVKRARLFFKAANLTSYLGNYTYYLAPHYPGRDARYYFGISWRFHD